MDIASIAGSVIGVVAILAGQVLEGGHVGQIMQATAALIVVGGTLGAMLVSFPEEDLKKAVSLIPSIYKKLNIDVRPVIDEIIYVATLARKEGVLAIESQRFALKNELFKKSIKYVIDGFEPQVVREIIESEIDAELEDEENAARVFEGAGGYAPTIGIIGAVLGLIHVMAMLNNPDKIGEGIAVAFVATVYGVGLSNLILIPWGTKLKRKAQQKAKLKELVKMGVIGIQEGLNPHFLKEKLEVFVAENLKEKRV